MGSQFLGAHAYLPLAECVSHTLFWLALVAAVQPPLFFRGSHCAQAHTAPQWLEPGPTALFERLDPELFLPYQMPLCGPVTALGSPAVILSLPACSRTSLQPSPFLTCGLHFPGYWRARISAEPGLVEGTSASPLLSQVVGPHCLTPLHDTFFPQFPGAPTFLVFLSPHW